MHPDLRKLGQAALAQCEHNQAQAKTWLIKQLLDDRDLFEAHILPLIETTVDGVLRELAGYERMAIRAGREQNEQSSGAATYRLPRFLKAV